MLQKLSYGLLARNSHDYCHCHSRATRADGVGVSRQLSKTNYSERTIFAENFLCAVTRQDEVTNSGI
jgi:hypothetical protein